MKTMGIFRKDKLVTQAKDINKILIALGIDEFSTQGAEIRSTVALELLGKRYPTMQQYSKAVFAKSVDPATMKMVMDTLREEGLLNKKGVAAIEHTK